MKHLLNGASSPNDISGAAKCVLHGAGDWDGGRKDRMIKEEATKCQDTEENIVKYPKTNEAEEELEDEQKEVETVNS